MASEACTRTQRQFSAKVSRRFDTQLDVMMITTCHYQLKIPTCSILYLGSKKHSLLGHGSMNSYDKVRIPLNPLPLGTVYFKETGKNTVHKLYC